MKNFLMSIKINVFIIVVASIAAGMAAHYFFQNKWLGFFFVALPLIALYMYQTYTKMADLDKKLKVKHKNKYR